MRNWSVSCCISFKNTADDDEPYSPINVPLQLPEVADTFNFPLQLPEVADTFNFPLQLPEVADTFVSPFSTNFKTIRMLGEGVFGIVFEAEKIHVENIPWRYAVKRIPVKSTTIDIALREVKALIEFDHKGIVRFYDAWKEEPTDGCPLLYIQMELCQSTLADWLAANKLRNYRRLKHWFLQLQSAVLYIHSMGKIHRDLKPSNILFADDDTLKVADLGIVTDNAIRDANGDLEADQERTFQMGTPKYMAPEQLSWAGEYSSKVDIFALGLILAEMYVTMSAEQATMEFEKYRNGRGTDMLKHLPDVERTVGWLTRVDVSQRSASNFFVFDKFDEFKTYPWTEAEKAFESELLQRFEVLEIIGQNRRYDHYVFKTRSLEDGEVCAVKRFGTQCPDNFEIPVLKHLEHEGLLSYSEMWLERPPKGFKNRLDAAELPVPGYKTWKEYPDDNVFLYVRMEFGAYSLADWLKDNDTRDLAQARIWFKEVASTVAYLHENRIVIDNLNERKIYVVNGRLKIRGIDFLSMASGAKVTHVDFKNNVYQLGIVLAKLCFLEEAQQEILGQCWQGKSSRHLDAQPEVGSLIAAMIWRLNPTFPTMEDVLKHDFLF